MFIRSPETTQKVHSHGMYTVSKIRTHLGTDSSKVGKKLQDGDSVSEPFYRNSPTCKQLLGKSMKSSIEVVKKKKGHLPREGEGEGEEEKKKKKKKKKKRIRIGTVF
ncbi:hypothetical protein NQZ68_012165 [Dissostichus eleginoides]|nr:hypothetical protein NQZ68_012165 [Dissostichus eleginoides]